VVSEIYEQIWIIEKDAEIKKKELDQKIERDKEKQLTERIIKLATQGDAKAQYLLGWFYIEGRGVLQDYKESVKWYGLAAEQGEIDALTSLGLMYYNGKSIIRDYVMAHMYWNIAAVSGDKDAIKYRGDVEEEMTTSQILEAQDLAREWMRKHQ